MPQAKSQKATTERVMHEYRKGDLLIIDDRASLHKAGFDYDHSQHRRLYRMLVRGDRPS